NFADQYIGSDTDGRVNILKSVAVEVEASLNQVVYAWMILNYPPVIPLLAASTTEQMQENLGALNVKLNSEQLNRLNNALTGGAAW
ncbi:aldo/keto reductase, partial [Candidatus Parcubacteria bacterium]|nr:aldo/keto reductase [Candidatus Parcubacteria bacterium]